MKQYFCIPLFLFAAVCARAQHSVEKLWQTDTVINLPESVLPDTKAGVLYVSIMGNSATDIDSIGGIGKLDMNGQVVDLNWVKGLNSPKGMAIHAGKMFVADVTDLAVIDIAKAKVIQRIPVPGSAFLNDVTADAKGVVYVSDSRTRKIHRFINGTVETYMENIDGLNGLKAVGDLLYIAGGGKSLLKADVNKGMIKVAGLPQGGDGIEPIGNGDFLFSSWGGYLYYVYADGRSDLLLDTHLEKINIADIGYDPVKRVVYIPTFFKKTVMAYQLK
ncbi:ATP-binding protein [Pedobacter deserti]|uniref:ATP-binding protein n=1 Tax=Pedobacter deserti TaxID=2817382 RepID=UPI002109F781|nr:ATP-binding protein [Pedobacter sp. SYSU D00382]